MPFGDKLGSNPRHDTHNIENMKKEYFMIRKKKRETEMVIDLTGPEGNAHVLLGYAKKFANQMGLESEQVLSEMKSGDYENLVIVFDNYFGEFVTLER